MSNEQESVIRMVHKFPLRAGRNRVKLPVGANLLSIQEQRGEIMVWFLVDPAEDMESERYFHVVGTGEPFDIRSHTYRGTVLLYGGQIVNHVFEWC